MKRDATLVVIASEDRYAVKQYFEFFHSTRIQFRVLETEHGDSAPSHVMARLSKFMKEYNLGKGDQLWLVCDTDHWIEPAHVKNLVEVLRLCRQKEIGVALSNPCFDLWLLLHFDEFPTNERLTCEQVGQMLRDKVGQYQKTRVYNLPVTQQGVVNAIRRAKSQNLSSGEIPMKPQTAVYQIIENLIERGVISVT